MVNLCGATMRDASGSDRSEDHSSTYSLSFQHVYEDAQKQQELVEALAQLFVALSRDMQLDVSGIESRGRYVCSVASTRTRAILFGSCPLEVKQKVDVRRRNASIHLEWLHPRPEADALGLSHVSIGVTKRAHFIQLFNASWTKSFKTHLIGMIHGDGSASDVPKENMQQLMQQALQCGFTKVKCDESVQRELQERFKRDLVFGTPMKQASSPSRVRFAQSPSIVSLPLTRAEREARMSSGSAVLPNGQPKPFRSVKTGDFIYLNVTEEDRQIIAPFNYPTEQKDMASIRRIIAPFNYASEVEKPMEANPPAPPPKKRPILDQDSTVKVVPHEAIDATIKRKGILKTRPATTKRFRPEIDRREIAPFNYPQEVDPT